MILKLYEKNNSRRDLDRIIEVLNSGGVIIYPTDTTYAIGCHALKERAIERVCEIKGVDTKHHLLSVVAHDISSVSEYVRIDNETFRIMRDQLPAPLPSFCLQETVCPRYSRTARKWAYASPTTI